MAKDPILETLEADRRTLIVRISRRMLQEIRDKPPGSYWVGDAMIVISDEDQEGESCAEQS